APQFRGDRSRTKPEAGFSKVSFGSSSDRSSSAIQKAANNGGLCCCGLSIHDVQSGSTQRIVRPLETQTQRELHLPRRPCAESLTERRTRLLACRRIKNRGRIDRAELRVVEDIIEFPSKRENALFIAKNEIAKQRGVEILTSPTSHGVFR